MTASVYSLTKAALEGAAFTFLTATSVEEQNTVLAFVPDHQKAEWQAIADDVEFRKTTSREAAIRRELERRQDLAEADRRWAEATAQSASFAVPGGGFILDAAATPPAVWGVGGDVLWAEGEALMLCGPSGVGKTTLAAQIVRGRLGLGSTVLGYPVQQGGGRVLYLACDRPAQASRAMQRLFSENDRTVLDERLRVWKGPPPHDFAKRPETLTEMCRAHGADTVIVDSLKDVALGLSGDEVGAGYNRARQMAIVSGVQVIEQHHQVKRGANGTTPNTLADVYGSTWITSGAGSVILLWGDAGDPVVSFRHLKQPMNEIGPFQVTHDHTAGTTSVHDQLDLVGLVRAAGGYGMTALTAAEALFEAKKPTSAQKEKARRKLDALCRTHELLRRDPEVKGAAATYYVNGHGPS
ncbi:AAA family ATPase [Streptomyces sp. NPDC059037]|uniref:AAA family ATPase n=1 Tax=Streptomyces sp. NPDC059037 TaxID=3346710 RepID=UPI003683F405